jgi:gamma-glutamyltranspeptidase/glutathione hydrolase
VSTRPPDGFTTRPTLQGTFGMVSSTHWLASQSAMAVLEAGGNAFDAAVAAGLVLQVVEPHLNGPGGEVPMIVVGAGETQPMVLAGQGPAPAGASIEYMRALGLDLVPGAGLLATTVPGAFDAWLLLLRDRGTLKLGQVARFAIEYSGSGHPISTRAVQTIASVADLFREHWTTSATLWLSDGIPPRPGTRFANTAWAATLQRIVTEGEAAGGSRESQIDRARRVWCDGFVAETIDRFARQAFVDSSGKAHRGVLTGADMANWSASWEEPVTASWRGFTVAKTGPWGQGPVLLQTLALIEAVTDGNAIDPGTADGAHLAVECLKLAMADREAWYGDRDDVPMSTLLSDSYNRDRAFLVGEECSYMLRPGRPEGRQPRIGRLAEDSFGAWAPRATDGLAATTGEPTVSASGVTKGDTVHVDVVDRWGNMISATPSGGWLQSSPTIPELGFCLGSRLQMTWLEEGLASSLTPGRRPRTTLSPTLVLRDGEPILACGTPGGDQQDQWQLVFLLRHLGNGMDLQQAIDEPTWHTNSFPGSFYPRAAQPGTLVVEDRIGSDTIGALERRGHRTRRVGPWELGRLCAVGRDPETAMLSAAANPRGLQGYAVGR